MVVESENETYRNKGLHLFERCTFRGVPGQPGTEKLSYARMTLPSFPLAGVCEGLMIKSYNKNTAKGVEIDKMFIKELIATGKVPTTPQPARILTPEFLIKTGGHDLFRDGEGAGSAAVAVEAVQAVESAAAAAAAEVVEAATEEEIQVVVEEEEEEALAPEEPSRLRPDEPPSEVVETGAAAVPARPKRRPRRDRKVSVGPVKTEAVAPGALHYQHPYGMAFALALTAFGLGKGSYLVVAAGLLGMAGALLLARMTSRPAEAEQAQRPSTPRRGSSSGRATPRRLSESARKRQMSRDEDASSSLSLGSDSDSEPSLSSSGSESASSDEEQFMLAVEHLPSPHNTRATTTTTTTTTARAPHARPASQTGSPSSASPAAAPGHPTATSPAGSVLTRPAGVFHRVRTSWVPARVQLFDKKESVRYVVVSRASGEEPVRVTRTLKDFSHLHRSLTASVPGENRIFVPLFPPKSVSDHIRHEGLSAYVYLVDAERSLASNPVIAKFLAPWPEDQAPLIPASAPAVRTPQVMEAVVKAGFVVRAHSRLVWEVEWCVLLQGLMLFYAAHDLKTPAYVVPLSGATEARAVGGGGGGGGEAAGVGERCPPPFPAAAFFEVSGQDGCVVTVWVTEGRAAAERWVRAVRDLAAGGAASASAPGAAAAEAVLRSPELARAQQHQSAARLNAPLNVRRVFWGTAGEPCAVAEAALEAVLAVLSAGVPVTELSLEDPRLREFDALVTELQAVQLKRIAGSDEAKLAFFLNVYHSLMLHSLVARGGEGKSGPRSKVFKDASYVIDGQSFSLSELDHAVLRHSMSSPAIAHSNFIGSRLVPRFKSNDTRRLAALALPEPRINFALNAGTLSCLAEVPVFRPSTVREQLDAYACLFCARFVRLAEDGTLTLPKILQYFAVDFAPNGNTRHLVLQVCRWLPRAIVDELTAKLSAREIKISFAPYDWGWRERFRRA
jgi:hypothetical protein